MAVKDEGRSAGGIVECRGVYADDTVAVWFAWQVGAVGVERFEAAEPAVASGANVRITGHRWSRW